MNRPLPRTYTKHNLDGMTKRTGHLPSLDDIHGDDDDDDNDDDDVKSFVITL